MAYHTETLDGVARLSQGQIDVLKGVALYKSSKVIARELGISPHTVDQRVKRVQAILGVTTRFEAARLYMTSLGHITTTDELENDESLWGELVYQSPALPGKEFAVHEGPSPIERNPMGDGSAHSLREAQAQYIAQGVVEPVPSSWFSVLFEGSRRNELTPTARTFTILMIMVMSILALSVLVSVAEGLSRII